MARGASFAKLIGFEQPLVVAAMRIVASHALAGFHWFVDKRSLGRIGIMTRAAQLCRFVFKRKFVLGDISDLVASIAGVDVQWTM